MNPYFLIAYPMPGMKMNPAITRVQRRHATVRDRRAFRTAVRAAINWIVYRELYEADRELLRFAIG